MNKNLIIALTVMLLVIVLGTYLAKGTGKPASTPSASIAPAETAKPTEAAVTKEIKVSAKEFGFTPDQITVKKGDVVKLTFTNDGAFSHDFVIEALGVRTNTIAAGESQTITFTPDKAGTFTFICTVDGHKNLGMEGQIVVE